MKKIEKVVHNKILKIVFFVIISIFLSIISTMSSYIAFYARNKQKVEIPLSTGTEISEIFISNNAYKLDDLKNDEIEYNNEKNTLTAKKDTFLVLEISKIDDISISYNKITSDDNRNIIIDDETYNFQDDKFFKKIPVLILVKECYSRYSIIIFIIYTIFFYISLYFIRKLLNIINNNNEKIYHIFFLLLIEFLICFFTVYGFMFIFKFLAIVPFVFLLFIILVKSKLCINSWSKIYIELGTIVGIMFLLLIPPGHVPDENFHFYRGFIDANYSFNEKDEIYLPESVEKFFYKFIHDVHSSDQEFSGKTYLSSIVENPEYSKLWSEKVNYENTKYLSFLPYIPLTITIFLCKVLNTPVLIMFMLSRFINLCICMILCYYAIKITPKFKKIFMLVALFPVFFQQAMGLNMDYLTNSISLILVALILNYKESDKDITYKQIFNILIFAIGIALCKFGYFPILWLVLLIPNNKFTSKKFAVIFKILFIFIPLIITFIFNFTAMNNTYIESRILFDYFNYKSSFTVDENIYKNFYI